MPLDSILLWIVYNSLRGIFFFFFYCGQCTMQQDYIYIYSICLFSAVGSVECIGTIVSLSVVSNVTEAG